MYNVLFAICNLFQIYEFWLLFNILLPKKNAKRIWEFLSFALFFLVNMFMHFVVNIPILTAVTCYLGLLVLTLTLYGGTWKQRILSSVFAYVIMAVAELIITIVIVAGQSQLHALESVDHANTLGTICLPILQYMVVLIVGRFKNMRQGQEVPILYWIMSVFLPMVSMYILFVVYQNTSLHWVNHLGVTGAVFGLNIFLFYLYDVQIANMRVKYEKENLEQQNIYQKNQLKIMHESSERLREHRHDFQKHISMISLLNDKKDTERLHVYLDEIQENMHKIQSFVDTGNFVVDSIVNYKVQEAVENGIKVVCDVQIPSELELSPYNMTTILTNLLDNSIEACRSQEKKEIKISIYYRKGALCVQIENPYEKICSDNTGNLTTTKVDKENHGYGLKNVESIVRKNEGEMKIETEQGVFRVVILLFV